MAEYSFCQLFCLAKSKNDRHTIDVGFISNPGEEALLAQASFRAEIVNAFARGIALKARTGIRDLWFWRSAYPLGDI